MATIQLYWMKFLLHGNGCYGTILNGLLWSHTEWSSCPMVTIDHSNLVMWLGAWQSFPLSAWWDMNGVGWCIMGRVVHYGKGGALWDMWPRDSPRSPHVAWWDMKGGALWEQWCIMGRMVHYGKCGVWRHSSNFHSSFYHAGQPTFYTVSVLVNKNVTKIGFDYIYPKL